MRILLIFMAVLLTIGAGSVAAANLSDVPQHLIQIESRPGIQTRMLLYRPDHPVATVVLFPDGSGRLELTHVFNTPQIGRSDKLPLELISRLVRQNISVLLMDVPTDHRSMLGINGWHGPRIFRLSADHARDIGAAVGYLRRQDPLPVWLAGIRMGAFSAANAAIHLQQAVAGLVIAGGITQCPEQHLLLQLCPDGLMGLPLDEITVPTLILSEEAAFPQTLLTSALHRSPAVSFQTYPEFAAFESWEERSSIGYQASEFANAHFSREMADFIAWNERTRPFLNDDRGPVEIAAVEVYPAGVYF